MNFDQIHPNNFNLPDYKKMYEDEVQRNRELTRENNVLKKKKKKLTEEVLQSIKEKTELVQEHIQEMAEMKMKHVEQIWDMQNNNVKIMEEVMTKHETEINELNTKPSDFIIQSKTEYKFKTPEDFHKFNSKRSEGLKCFFHGSRCFNSKKAFNRHIVENHILEGKYKCQTCSKIFDSHERWKQHRGRMLPGVCTVPILKIHAMP